MFNEIDRKKAIIDSKRPLPAETVESIRKHLFLEWTYNSNAIEGNTLILNETKVILEDGITIGGKSLREHLEVINHREAIGYIEEIVNENLTEWHIKNIHKLILDKIDTQNAGVYRNKEVIISGASHRPPTNLEVPALMKDLLEWYHNDGQKMHPVERGAILHTKFVYIHPFIDGNGRTARLLLNLELMKHGYPIVIIKKEDRNIYYDALDKGCSEGDYSDFIKLVVDSLNRSLDLYLDLM